MNAPRARLLELIRRHALLVRGPEEPPFRLKSGAESRTYLDCRRLTLHAEGLAAAVHCLWDELRFYSLDSRREAIQAVGGPTVGADPLVAGVLLQSTAQDGPPLRGFLVRGGEKDHGLAGRVIGSVRPGDRCLLIEDVVTSGGSVLEAAAALREFGAEPLAVMCLVDREQGGREALRAAGLPFFPLVTSEDLELDL